MGLAVDASSHPAHDDEPGRSEVARQRSRDRATVRGAGARADQRNRGSVEERRVRGSAKEEGWRRIVDRGKQRRKAGVAAADRRDRGHFAAISPGIRYESASATCAGSTEDAPARAAIVRATRATRARPRPDRGKRSTALDRSSDAASVRRGGEWSRRSRAPTHASPHLFRCLRQRRRELCRTRSRHRDSEIEPVEEGTRELLPVRREPLWRARALDSRIAAAAARAHVHGADELETRREDRVPADARDRDEAVLERLSQRLQNGARKLRQLVHEQHAAMGQGDLARPRARPSSDDRRRRRPVVRGAKRAAPRRAHVRAGAAPRPSGCASPRAPPLAPASGGSLASAARASSCRCRVAPSAGGCATRPRRSRARGAHAPGRGDPTRSGTAPFSIAPSSIGSKRGSVDVPAEVLDDLGEVTNGDRLDSGERCLRCRLGSTHETA